MSKTDTGRPVFSGRQPLQALESLGALMPDGLDTFLRHPLFLLLISGLIIPAVVRMWQTRQKELEVKGALVTEISQVTMGLIARIQFLETADREHASEERRAEMQHELDAAYHAWLVGVRVVHGKIAAFFPGTRLADDWLGFSDEVEQFYFEAGAMGKAPTYAVDIAKRLEKISKKKVGLKWHERRDAVLGIQEDLVARLLRARVSAFSIFPR